MRSIIIAAVFLGSFHFLSGCSTNDDVGARKIPVTLTVTVGTDSMQGFAPAATIYVLEHKDWNSHNVKSRVAQQEQLMSSGKTDEASLALRALLDDLEPYRQQGQAPLTLKLWDFNHYFLANIEGRLQFMEFRPTRNRTPTLLFQ